STALPSSHLPPPTHRPTLSLHDALPISKDGLQSARARGRIGGRPRVNKRDIERAVKLYESEAYSGKEITEMTGISKATLYRYIRSEEHTSELQSRFDLVCRLLLEKKT